jgi:hypothetical protein
MKDFVFSQRLLAAISPSVVKPTALGPQTVASPYTLSAKLLGDLAMVFDRESRQATSRHERLRLYGIYRELDRLWRVKAGSVRR